MRVAGECRRRKGGSTCGLHGSAAILHQPAPACCARKVAEQRTFSSYESRIPPSFRCELMQALTPSGAGAFCRIQFKIAGVELWSRLQEMVCSPIGGEVAGSFLEIL